MLRRRIRSALYIDFENVPLSPETIGNWLAWLEDGAFDPGGRRRSFLQKRVYWNSHAERNRDVFRRHGFVPILIGKYSGLKNGADIRMAMDVVETTYTRAEIDEFILLTGDSDFVPVLERLRQKGKRSAIVATEHRPNIHTTYNQSADLLIPSRRLTEAGQYRRPRPGVLGRLLARRFGHRAHVNGTPLPGQLPGQSSAAPIQAHAPRRPSPEQPVQGTANVLENAARRVAKLLTQQPRNYVAQKRVLSELDRMQGFKRQGPTAFFGMGSYRTLMQELSRLEPRISVVEQPGGGTGVVFIPPGSTATEAAGQRTPGSLPAQSKVETPSDSGSSAAPASRPEEPPNAAAAEDVAPDDREEATHEPGAASSPARDARETAADEGPRHGPAVREGRDASAQRPAIAASNDA